MKERCKRMGEELNHGVFGYKVERKHTFAQVQAGVLHFRLENYMHTLHVGCTHYAV